MKQLSPRVFFIFGAVAIAASLCILGLTFYPMVLEEFRYNARTLTAVTQPNRTIIPIDETFGIVIPKLGANARIIANVNPYNANEYQYALTQGVAHARGSALPDEPGTLFLFSHSSVNFYEAARYNSVFYLLHKLESGNRIDIYYRQQKYSYSVTGKKLVNPKEVSYLTNSSSDKTLILMTCWPPGTTYKRLIVMATPVDD